MGNPETDPAFPQALEAMPAGFAATWLIFRVLGPVLTVPIAVNWPSAAFFYAGLFFPLLRSLPLPFFPALFFVFLPPFGALQGCWLVESVACFLFG